LQFLFTSTQRATKVKFCIFDSKIQILQIKYLKYYTFNSGFPNVFLRLQEFVTKLQEIVEKFGKIEGSPGKFKEKTAGVLLNLLEIKPIAGISCKGDLGTLV
jgi:hypothetical protein